MFCRRPGRRQPTPRPQSNDEVLLVNPRRDPPQLAFNFLPVTFTATTFDGGEVRYTSAEQLTEIRAKLAGTHVVTRIRDSIKCIPIVDGADPYGTPTTFSLRDNKSLTMRLAE